MKRGSPTTRRSERQPVFQIGDAVRTRNIHPATHTRLPRYARDKPGVVVVLHGAHVFPDTNALLQGENPRALHGEIPGARFVGRGRQSARHSLHRPVGGLS
jgi:nitrile hydratase